MKTGNTRNRVNYGKAGFIECGLSDAPRHPYSLSVTPSINRVISAPFELDRIHVPLNAVRSPFPLTCSLFVRCAIVDSEWSFSVLLLFSRARPRSNPSSLSSRFLRVNRLHRRHSKSRLRHRRRRRVAKNGRFLSTPIFPMSTRRARVAANPL